MKLSEHDIQVLVIKWFDLQYKSFSGRLFAIPNGGLRHVVTAKKMKAEGVRSGVPDLFLPVPRIHAIGLYSGLFIEMKSEKGKLSSNQNDWLEFLENQGYQIAVCNSFESAKKVIEEYLK